MRLAEVFVCTSTDFLGMKLGKQEYFTKVCPTAQNTLLKYWNWEFFDTKNPSQLEVMQGAEEVSFTVTGLRDGEPLLKGKVWCCKGRYFLGKTAKFLGKTDF